MRAMRSMAAMVVLALAGCATQSVQPAATLQQRLDAVLGRDSSTGQIFAARVVDLESGRELYARSADEAMIPASNMKLFVTAAALDFLGPEHRFKTYLAMDGEDLWVIGSGDPA